MDVRPRIQLQEKTRRGGKASKSRDIVCRHNVDDAGRPIIHSDVTNSLQNDGALLKEEQRKDLAGRTRDGAVAARMTRSVAVEDSGLN
jgi:hypothetical protein